MAKLAREGRFDHLLVESTGVSEPMPVAATFELRDESGASLSDLARLDTMVTVVDAERFLLDWQSEDDLAARRAALGPEDERTVADLVVDQVEFADVLVVSKTDRVTPPEAERVEALLRLLNPDAELVRAVHGVVPLHRVLDTGRFDRARASRSPGWARALAGGVVPESEEYGVRSFVFRADRPLHPARLHAFLEEGWSGVLRSKGFLWIASRPERASVWSHAGPSASLEPGGLWGSSGEEDGWGMPRQELVFIGVDMDEAALLAGLDACLLDAAELAEGEAGWRRYPDPFSRWEDEDAAGDGRV